MRDPQGDGLTLRDLSSCVVEMTAAIQRGVTGVTVLITKAGTGVYPYSQLLVPPPTAVPLAFNLPGNFFNKRIESRKIYPEKILLVRFVLLQILFIQNVEC